jgi:hypothetical protein
MAIENRDAAASAKDQGLALRSAFPADHGTPLDVVHMLSRQLDSLHPGITQDAAILYWQSTFGEARSKRSLAFGQNAFGQLGSSARASHVIVFIACHDKRPERKNAQP